MKKRKFKCIDQITLSLRNKPSQIDLRDVITSLL